MEFSYKFNLCDKLAGFEGSEYIKHRIKEKGLFKALKFYIIIINGYGAGDRLI